MEAVASSPSSPMTSVSAKATEANLTDRGSLLFERSFRSCKTSVKELVSSIAEQLKCFVLPTSCLSVPTNDAFGKRKECGGGIKNSVVLQPPIDWIRSIKINPIED